MEDTRRSLTVRLALALLIPALLLGAAMAVDRIAARRALVAVDRRSRTTGLLLGASFRRELEKFRLTAVALAGDGDARSALAGRDPTQLAALNRKLEALAARTGAANIYLLDTRGITVAASNWRRADSFLGNDYAYRAYFRQAMRHGQAQQFALGTQSGRPGLYMTNAVTAGGRPIGIMVVKVEFTALEAEWRRTPARAFVTDRRGIILVTTNPAWRFTTIRPLPPAERAAVRRSLVYGAVPLALNPMVATRQIAPADAARRAPYVETVEPVAGGWRVHILAPTAPAIASAVGVGRAILAALVVASAALLLLWRHRRRLAAARAEAAEEARIGVLREQLVQASKLATLGQITAGVAHEINQPVAAIAAYAHNARAFLDRGDSGGAADAVERIGGLAQRIGLITRELRGFSRRASGVLEPVAVAEAIDGVQLLLRDRLRRTDAVLEVHLPAVPLRVMAERVRLEQVLVNLVQNALDAGARTVMIAVRPGETRAEIAVADDGPGLMPEGRAGLFQPFSTTKADGLGLGLVICRDIVAGFGGTLEARDPPRGAEFAFTLELVP